MTQALNASVDLAVCKGHGRCYMTAPEIFDCDDAGFPLVIGTATTEQQISDLQRAVNNCPEQAVSVSPAG
ncbi:ferredoxin [Nocardioides daejeonensis]|uniref:ferredoxin n=1 Tax=Nocardioides daejeonensis TaxID=1046556 RepID=UPI000D7486E1|nr:ferredoxin [Nocardioides daejeonensis]